MRQRQLDADTVVYRQDEPGDSMLVVVQGRLAVSYQRKSGEEVMVNTADPGEVLGELSFIDPAPRSAQVRTIEPSIVYELDRMVLQSLLQSAPAVAGALMRGVIEIATARSRELEDLILAALAALRKGHAPARASAEAEALAERGRPPRQRGAPRARRLILTMSPSPPVCPPMS